MCHFHQKQIVRRYITKNPKPHASMLKHIIYSLTKTNENNFKKRLCYWYAKHTNSLRMMILVKLILLTINQELLMLVYTPTLTIFLHIKIRKI